VEQKIVHRYRRRYRSPNCSGFSTDCRKTGWRGSVGVMIESRLGEMNEGVESVDDVGDEKG